MVAREPGGTGFVSAYNFADVLFYKQHAADAVHVKHHGERHFVTVFLL